jgi:hypothetical protein
MRQRLAALRKPVPPRPRPALFSRARVQEGVSDLGRTLRQAESSRVLNLSQIEQRWGLYEDYAARPLFDNKLLNRAIIMKCAPRPGELFEYGEQRLKSTKVLFPFDRKDLSLGGFSALVGQKNFLRVMSRHLHGSGRLSERDERVLNLLDQLPTLDPFLLHALLKSNGLDVSEAYFQLSPADREAIQQEMTNAFAPLVLLCFPDGRFEADAIKGFIGKMLNFEESAEIDSLRAAFRLNEPLFSIAMFAWRGIIYYEWRTARLNPALDAAVDRIRKLKFVDTDTAAGADQGEQSRAKILRTAATAAARVREITGRYDAAFADFVEQRQAEQFRQFLVSAPSLFLICGQSMAIMEHIVNFIEAGWGADRRDPAAPPRHLAERFRELERELDVECRVRLMSW